LATYLLENFVEIMYLNLFLDQILGMKSNFFKKKSFEYTKTIFLIQKIREIFANKRERERKKKEKRKKKKKVVTFV
jgi:hypothetical protein